MTSKARALANFPSQIINLINEGADPTGVADSAAAFDGQSGQRNLTKGAYKLSTTPVFDGPTLLSADDATFTGSGASAIGLLDGPRRQEHHFDTTSTDYATRYLRRNANHTGGAVGYVNSTFRADVFVADGVTNFEWAIVGVLQNYASAGENCGGYFQGNMRGTGTTFGGVFEAIDMSYTSSAGKGALIGAEIDCYFNAADTDSRRIGLQVVAGDAQFNRTGVAGTAGYATYGVVTLSQAGGAACVFKNDFIALSGTDTAFQAAATGDKAFRITGTYVVGLDMRGGTITSASISLSQDSPITYGAAQTRRTEYDGIGLKYAASGTTRFRTLDNGTFESQLFTVATLPTPGSVGRRSFATDLSSVAYRATAAGGGSGKSPVFDDGANWIVGG